VRMPDHRHQQEGMRRGKSHHHRTPKAGAEGLLPKAPPSLPTYKTRNGLSRRLDHRQPQFSNQISVTGVGSAGLNSVRVKPAFRPMFSNSLAV
jgi:hypothetical protein